MYSSIGAVKIAFVLVAFFILIGVNRFISRSDISLTLSDNDATTSNFAHPVSEAIPKNEIVIVTDNLEKQLPVINELETSNYLLPQSTRPQIEPPNFTYEVQEAVNSLLRLTEVAKEQDIELWDSTYEFILELDPENLDALIAVAHMHWRKGNLNIAETILQDMVDFHVSKIRSDERMEVYVELVRLRVEKDKMEHGNQFIDRTRYDEALNYSEKYNFRDARHELLKDRALYSRDSDPKLALKDMEKARVIMPSISTNSNDSFTDDRILASMQLAAGDFFQC